MSLEQQISERSKDISTDSYAMSVGELMTLYRDKELNLHPEFQRFFRWSDEQKSRLIESLLLGIPIPPIFVSQDQKGKWDVIDGLQRLSTILQLTGDLKNEKGEQVTPLVLQKTKYLPALQGKCWTTEMDASPDLLPETAKLLIKRARIDLKIVLNKSDASSKYELFDRLNTGGSAATDQEVRNCILIMLNKTFFERLSALGDDTSFKACIPLTDRQIQEQFNLELVVRFLTLRTASVEELKAMPDLGPFLTERITIFAQDATFDWATETKAFIETFKLLAESLGEDAFKKFYSERVRGGGPVLVSLFEVLAVGLGYHIVAPGYKVDPARIQAIHKDLWKNDAFLNGTGSGIRPTTRIPVTIALGRQLFKM